MVCGAYIQELLPVINKAECTESLQKPETKRELKVRKVSPWAVLCSYHGVEEWCWCESWFYLHRGLGFHTVQGQETRS